MLKIRQTITDEIKVLTDRLVELQKKLRAIDLVRSMIIEEHYALDKIIEKEKRKRAKCLKK